MNLFTKLATLFNGSGGTKTKGTTKSGKSDGLAPVFSANWLDATTTLPLQPRIPYVGQALPSLDEDGLGAIATAADVGGIYTATLNSGTRGIFVARVPRPAAGISQGPITIKVKIGDPAAPPLILVAECRLVDDGYTPLSVVIVVPTLDTTGRPIFKAKTLSATSVISFEFVGLAIVAGYAPTIYGFSKNDHRAFGSLPGFSKAA